LPTAIKAEGENYIILHTNIFSYELCIKIKQSFIEVKMLEKYALRQKQSD